jgi:serine/threonine-protein kinase PpkA
MMEKGKKVGEYVLLEKLGAGGFGDVWKAEKRTALDINHFALKFFRPKQDGVDFDKIGKELSVWKQLKGLPHIISVIELDRFEDYVYVVSDYADGGSLEKWLKTNGGKASSEAEAVQIALEILTGLENLHGKNFVHRDLKPDNVLIMNGRFCLTDFGISREIKTHSKATGTAGTMEYMPPEAFEKTPSVTPQTDIWAVGVILQRLLTGNLPYPQDDQPSLIAAILMSEPDEMPETVSESLRSIVNKALQKKRENRFQTANEMREILRNAVKDFQKLDENQSISQAETIESEDLDKTIPTPN